MKKLSLVFLLLAVLVVVPAYAGEWSGEFTMVEGKKNTHTAGKVKLKVFFDFFCSHCYTFDTITVDMLKKTYGNKMEIEYIGFPLWDYSGNPIEAYEIAKEHGKGVQMRNAIFEAIHEKRQKAENPLLLAEIAEDVGLDKKMMLEGIKKHIKINKVFENTRRGKSYKLRSTPTIIIDNNIKVTNNSHGNIDEIIIGLLSDD